MSNFIKPIKISNRLWMFFIFLATVIFLLMADITTIKLATYESGDFAANSLLIQEAKSFSLWVGNYSRVGFNHPGPAILYVLAIGELLFHDWLHIVQYPFAGQLIAVAFYNAFWIVLLLSAFNRLCASRTAAVATLSVFLLTLALMDYEFFNGIWMPNLYLFPFAVMLVSIARLTDGKVDSLQALALSSGFLINGHVSFVALLGIILIFTVIANYVLLRQSKPTGRVIVSPAFLTANKRPLVLAGLTLFVFFIPLIIKTITDFPGPVMQYAAFGDGHEPNPLSAAVEFITYYWGGGAFAAIALVVACALFFLSSRLPQDLRSSVKAGTAALVAATFSLLFYARYGIDFLDQRYIGYFYYSVPALAAAYIALLLTHWIGSRPRVLLGASLAALIATFVIIDKPVGYDYFYRYTGVADAYEQLNAIRTDSPLVLNLSDGPAWGQIWTSTLALQVYADRKNFPLFCINKNWHLSNTKAYRCSPEEVRKGKQLSVTAENQYPNEKATLTSLGVSFYTIPDINQRGSVTLDNSIDDFKTWFLASGWSNSEKEFVWSDGPQAHLYLAVAPGSAGNIDLDLQAFVPLADSEQNVTFYLNDTLVTHALFTQKSVRQRVRIPVTGKQRRLDIKIIIEHPLSPQEISGSGDTRKLGVALFGFEFQGVKQ
ncbi:hypothetical protein QN391_17865 [Pseudomonas sp. CCI1.2]|uniref:hypothetical protein n=1 Tax=Pseudomonas sp. CCI1.2 TaxID=3048614 RepID=UPI002B22DC1F|nr:hypothetical protein [Pseudomonas sp. CCI1.2]MEB0122545.1 hypothetical protein [Pseudomonas sp. CCI1.2]